MYYEITYIRAGKVKDTDRITIWDGEEMKNGEKVHDIISAIKSFEEASKEWGTFETRCAITDIKAVDVKDVIAW